MSKIAIVGTAPSSRNLAPFDDPSWEIWACSPGNIDIPRADVWFELHSLDAAWPIDTDQKIEYIKFLKDHPKVYTVRKYPGFKNSIPYPIETIIGKYGQYFLTSSISLMMAEAIGHKPETIGIFGVDMAVDDEYAYQRSGCHFFIRECHQQNITLLIPPESDLAEPPPVYGLCMESRMWRKLEARRIEQMARVAEYKATAQRARDDEMKLAGALENTEYMQKTWVR